MKTTPSDSSLPSDHAAAKLASALDQSEQIKNVVEVCAEELSTVNSVLKTELGAHPVPPSVDEAIQQNEIVENKVQNAAEDLSNVNRAMEAEVKERQVLEQQLVATKKQEEAARHAAFHDSLTALPNRVLFNDRLEHGLAQAKRHEWTLAVMFIDLNNFKVINDTYGHEAGDQVLQEIASRLKAMTREDDTVSRRGGDEFLYLLLELKDEADAILIAEKIVRTVSAPCELVANGVAISASVTPSVGIAIFPRDGETADSLVKSADKAMYQAKRDKSGYSLNR